MTYSFINNESEFVSASELKKIEFNKSKNAINHIAKGQSLCNGEYIINNVIGHGGFGITYAATSAVDGSIVAIKELFMSDCCSRDHSGNVFLRNHSSAKDKYNLARNLFLNEALNTMNCIHPNIVRVFDYFEDNNTVYYVMEYVTGHTLEQELRKSNGLDAYDAVSYIIDIARAVRFMHRCNFAHLDIKPSNIMLRNSGKAVLIDFGSSRSLSDDNDNNDECALVLSKGYYSEDMLDDATDACKKYVKMDIFALGTTLYRLITCALPSAYSRQYTSIPSAVKEIIDRARDISGNGYTGISEFISDLCRFMNNRGIINIASLHHNAYTRCA